ncbi:MAG: hypothetical protein ACRCSB_00195 [Bacteroidales bacterium]
MVAKRVGEFIEVKGISYYAFENLLGVSRGTISKSVKENKSIGSAILEKILAIFPELSPVWLLTGNGEMLQNADIPSSINVGHSINGTGNTVSGDISFGECVRELEAARKEISYLKEINELLKNKK